MPRLVPAHQPYDGGRMLAFLGRHATPGGQSYDENARTPTYARVLRLAGGPGTVRLSWTDGGYDADLRLSRAGDEAEALETVGRLLDLATDPAPALTRLADDPLLDVAARPGVRIPGSVDPVETLVETVIGQQVSLAGARTLSGRLVQRYGQPLPPELAGHGLTHCFPTPAELAAVDPAQLSMPLARGRSIVAIGRAVLEQGEKLASGRPETARDLMALPGVGPWTASYLALRVGRDPDAFMPTDLAVRRAFEANGRPGDPRAVAAHAVRWSPYRGTALMHLWFGYLERPPGQAARRARSSSTGTAAMSVVEGTLEP